MLEVAFLDDAAAGEAHERGLQRGELVHEVLAKPRADEVRANRLERHVVEFERAASRNEEREGRAFAVALDDDLAERHVHGESRFVA